MLPLSLLKAAVGQPVVRARLWLGARKAGGGGPGHD